MERQQRGGAEYDGGGRIHTLVEGVPSEAFDLIDIIGKPGQVFPGVQLVELPMIFLQQRCRHIPPDGIVHRSNRAALKKLLQAVDPKQKEPRAHHHQNPKTEPTQVALNDTLESLNHHQAGSGLQGAHGQNRKDCQEIGPPKLLQIMGHTHLGFFATAFHVAFSPFRLSMSRLAPRAAPSPQAAYCSYQTA